MGYLVAFGAVVGLLACAGLVAIGYLVYRAVSGAPRACAFPGCTTNHWNLEKFCSHHILDEYEEEHGRGSRPGRRTVDEDGDGC